MNISFWQLGWRTLWRDVRAGELRLLMVAVVLAVAALSSVSFFADRLLGGLQRDARQLLGGDAVVASDNALPAAFTEKAQALGLQMVQSISFPTMARAQESQGGATKLVALKGVQTGYPLRGVMRLLPTAVQASAPAAANISTATSTSTSTSTNTTTNTADTNAANLGVPAQGIPERGQAWVDPSLLDTLGIKVGDTLLLGQSRFTVAAAIGLEPDRGAGFINFSPRVMVNYADLADTGLIQPASRLSYRLALAGADAAVKQFVQWADVQVKTPQIHGVRVESLQTGRPEMRQTLERAQKFLSLVALLAALLSAVAVALAARAFAAQHLDDCAMLRVLGLSQRAIASAYVVEFGLVGLFSSLVGVVLGFAVHYLFVLLMAGLVDAALPAATWWPVGLGVGVGLTLLCAFGLPPVLQLAQVPALRVIRRDVGNLRPSSLAVLGLGVAGFAALLLVASSDVQLGLIAVGGFAAAVLVFAGFAWVAVKLLRRLVNDATAPRWLVLATRQISARPAYTVVQVSALSVGLLALVLLVLLRTDLIGSWRKATPPDAPNRFVINIMPEQSDAFRQALQQAGVRTFDWYPMARGRLVAINDRPVSAEDYPDEKAKRLVDREFNLSHSATQPAHNILVAGVWRNEEAGAISMEDGIATTLGLKLGDKLVFDIGGMPIESRITSLRKVDWGSMRANFFAMFPVSDLGGVPETYISAFKAPPTAGFDNALVRQFPNITNVDMTITLNQVQRVLDQVIRAVEFLFGFTLAAGLVVLFAAVAATRDERTREFAIMRAVGAQATLLRQVQRAELAGVGLLAGLLASLLASAIGWALARFVFEFAWSVSFWTPLLGALAGAALALAAGWWGLRDVLRKPVVDTLRRAAV